MDCFETSEIVSTMSKTIVWIDDDYDTIETVVSPLIKAGYRIVCLRNGSDVQDSIDLIRHSDLILLDLILPSGDLDIGPGPYSGAEVLLWLREIHKIRQPVIIFSVVDPSRVVDMIQGLGVVDHVRKPALPSELAEAVENALTSGGAADKRSEA